MYIYVHMYICIHIYIYIYIYIQWAYCLATRTPFGKNNGEFTMHPWFVF